MRRKPATTTLIAIALVFAPTAAAARQHLPQPAAAQIEPASEHVEGSQVRGGYLLPLALLVAIIVGVVLLTKNGETDMPVSP
jgi:hypothetical protein